MTTNNPAENRNRQPEGAPDSKGGQFANELPKPDADTELTAQTIVFTVDEAELEARHDASNRGYWEANSESHLVAAATIAHLVLEQYPDAAWVELGESDQHHGHDIELILDGNRNVLSACNPWDDEDPNYLEIGDDLWSYAAELPECEKPIGADGDYLNGYDWYVVDEGDGRDRFYIDIAQAVHQYEVGAINAHFTKITKDAGLGVMKGVLEVLRDRETFDDERFKKMTAEDVTNMYFNLLAPAIDRIEAGL